MQRYMKLYLHAQKIWIIGLALSATVEKYRVHSST